MTGEKPRRLTLIDQSIKHPGGHHYEYALRVLDAARRQGLETWLLAHKDYRGQMDHPVEPAFTWTFWDNYSFYYLGRPPLRRLGRLAALRRRMKEVRLTLDRRFIYSRIGLAVARARHVPLRDILLRSRIDDDASTITTSRPLLAAARIALKLRSLVTRRLHLNRLRPLLLAVLALPALPFLFIAMLSGRKSPAARFAGELSRALAEPRDHAGTDLLRSQRHGRRTRRAGAAASCRTSRCARTLGIPASAADLFRLSQRLRAAGEIRAPPPRRTRPAEGRGARSISTFASIPIRRS